MKATEVAPLAERLVANIGRVILGKPETVRHTAVALLCSGHVLFEDVPGVGKTMLARAVAKSVGGTYKRIQFTPDLLPSDVTGVSIYHQGEGTFRFSPGPLFAHVVLADEINRATPRTQSSLLEGMDEGQVTVDGVAHSLPQPFMVLATENPIEYEGTYPLPEAQLDRFLMRLRLGYPSREVELDMMQRQQLVHPIVSLEQVLEPGEVLEAQQAVRTVAVQEAARDYILDLVAATRSHPLLYLGASPRGSLALSRAAQGLAAVEGSDYVLPDHVQALAGPVLAHRLIVRPEARIGGTTAEAVVAEIVASVPVD